MGAGGPLTRGTASPLHYRGPQAPWERAGQPWSGAPTCRRSIQAELEALASERGPGPVPARARAHGSLRGGEVEDEPWQGPTVDAVEGSLGCKQQGASVSELQSACTAQGLFGGSSPGSSAHEQRALTPGAAHAAARHLIEPSGRKQAKVAAAAGSNHVDRRARAAAKQVRAHTPSPSREARSTHFTRSRARASAEQGGAAVDGLARSRLRRKPTASQKGSKNEGAVAPEGCALLGSCGQAAAAAHAGSPSLGSGAYSGVWSGSETGRRLGPPPTTQAAAAGEHGIAIDGVKISRSGRAIVPRLAYWRNQALVHAKDGSIVAVLDGSPDLTALAQAKFSAEAQAPERAVQPGRGASNVAPEGPIATEGRSEDPLWARDGGAVAGLRDAGHIAHYERRQWPLRREGREEPDLTPVPAPVSVPAVESCALATKKAKRAGLMEEVGTRRGAAMEPPKGAALRVYSRRRKVAGHHTAREIPLKGRHAAARTAARQSSMAAGEQRKRAAAAPLGSSSLGARSKPLQGGRGRPKQEPRRKGLRHSACPKGVTRVVAIDDGRAQDMPLGKGLDKVLTRGLTRAASESPPPYEDGQQIADQCPQPNALNTGTETTPLPEGLRPWAPGGGPVGQAQHVSSSMVEGGSLLLRHTTMARDSHVERNVDAPMEATDVAGGGADGEADGAARDASSEQQQEVVSALEALLGIQELAAELTADNILEDIAVPAEEHEVAAHLGAAPPADAQKGHLAPRLLSRAKRKASRQAPSRGASRTAQADSCAASASMARDYMASSPATEVSPAVQVPAGLAPQGPVEGRIWSALAGASASLGPAGGEKGNDLLDVARGALHDTLAAGGRPKEVGTNHSTEGSGAGTTEQETVADVCCASPIPGNGVLGNNATAQNRSSNPWETPEAQLTWGRLEHEARPGSWDSSISRGGTQQAVAGGSSSWAGKPGAEPDTPSGWQSAAPSPELASFGAVAASPFSEEVHARTSSALRPGGPSVIGLGYSPGDVTSPDVLPGLSRERRDGNFAVCRAAAHQGRTAGLTDGAPDEDETDAESL